MRLIFCIQRKPTISGLKVREFRYDANLGLHVYQLKTFDVEEFNKVARDVLTKNADLLAFVQAIHDDVQPVATAESASVRLDGSPIQSVQIVPPVALPVVDPTKVSEGEQAIAALTKVNDLLDTWPGASDEPLSVNVARLIAENAALKQQAASPVAPLHEQTRERKKPGRKAGFKVKDRANAPAVVHPSAAVVTA